MNDILSCEVQNRQQSPGSSVSAVLVIFSCLFHRNVFCFVLFVCCFLHEQCNVSVYVGCTKIHLHSLVKFLVSTFFGGHADRCLCVRVNVYVHFVFV